MRFTKEEVEIIIDALYIVIEETVGPMNTAFKDLLHSIERRQREK